jgi:predicted porin
VGLQSGFGSLVGGRIAWLSSGTGSFDMWGQVDPYVTGFGDSGVQNTFSSAGALRTDNTILYKSPTFAGFTVGGTYSFNAVGSESALSNANMDAWGLAGSWGAGPFYAVVTYDSIDPPTTLAGIPVNADEQTNLQIGGTFDFKIVKLHAAYAIEDNVWFTTGGGAVVTLETVSPGADADAWMVGVTVPLFGGSIMASYQDRDGDSIVIGGVARERDLSIWSAAYTYPLSRRTNLYINYSDKDGDKSANGVASLDRSQFTMGLRHLF